MIYRGGTWFVDQYHNGTVDKIFNFGGMPGDKPLAGDVNGDGIADLVIYRNGIWYIDTNRDGVADMTVFFGGMPQDVPLLLDWDGDGKADFCIFRDGVWYVNTKRDGTAQASIHLRRRGRHPVRRPLLLTSRRRRLAGAATARGPRSVGRGVSLRARRKACAFDFSRSEAACGGECRRSR